MVLLKLTLSINFLSNSIHAQLPNNQNEALASCSNGQLKFKGTTKKSLVAAKTLAIWLAGKIIDLNVKLHSLIISMRGISPFKRAFLRKFSNFQLPAKYILIQQNFRNSHNGCKLSKKRRK